VILAKPVETCRGKSSGAERQRRWRRRRACGEVVVQLGVSEQVVGALIESGRLHAVETLDRNKLARALDDIVAAWARQWR
jgi:hypothetical protein